MKLEQDNCNIFQHNVKNTDELQLVHFPAELLMMGLYSDTQFKYLQKSTQLLLIMLHKLEDFIQSLRSRYSSLNTRTVPPLNGNWNPLG